MNAVVTTTQQNTSLAQYSASNTILGERQVSLSVGGKIRGGIKVLTQKGASNPKAKEIYDRMFADRKPFDDIEKELSKNGIEKVLTPKNINHFVVRGADFSMPECADRIMSLYGEDRGEGVKLYRFPIILPLDQWQAVIPHSLKCYTASELRYWSDYGPDGVRYCKTRQAVPIDPRSKRPTRIFGGRPVVFREENSGVCDPEQCPEYQNRKCNLTGSFVFFVPGIPGTSAVEVPTNSFYALNEARKRLETVAFMRGGRISGTNNGKPIFWLAKKQHEVSMIDKETGQAKRVKQWLIEIEADVDVSKLLREADGDDVDAIADNSYQTLTGDNPVAALAQAPTEVDNAPREISGEVLPPENVPETPPPASGGEGEEGKQELASKRKAVLVALNKLGIDTASYDEYATMKWGAGWGKRLDSIRLAFQAIEEAAPKCQLINDAVIDIGVDHQVFAAYAVKTWGKDWYFDSGTLQAVVDELDNAMDHPDDYKALIG